MNVLSRISVAITIILLLTTSYGQAQISKNNIAVLDSLLETQSPRPFNGVVLITQDDDVLYQKALGFKNFEQSTALEVDDQFVINSNSKQITAALILLEVEKGTINLQAPINTYLPKLKQDWASTVTVHQLLNHTHGIAELDKPLLFQPGSDFKYGNLSNVLLGQIITTVTKKSYTEVAEALFNKLGMNHSVANAARLAPRLVSGHINESNKFSIAKKIKKKHC